MALTYSTPTELMPLGSPAPDFSLSGTDGKTYSLASFDNKKALLVIFMCNHCPYVIATQDRINKLAKEYGNKGLALVGINANDAEKYPEDSFENMKLVANKHGYVFPYLYDETQKVARSYDAVCTPDPYLFEKSGNQFLLRYHGRIDDSWKDERAVKERDLAKAIEAILNNKPISTDQKPAMGCSIKWK
ncbi:MAG: thioredoxin family protein [Bdellovibrio sp.]|nr:thioredoxin family protein [Bdellovibrio sp.]